MTGSLVAQGFALMLYGMGTVLLFLTLLVLVTTFMSRCVTRFFPEPVAPDTPSAPAPQDEAIVAVITAAVHRYRSGR